LNDPEIERPSTTEDAPATPGWVEGEFDEIVAGLPRTPVLARLRVAYLDCLAGIGGPADIEGAHDRCRAAFLRGLEGERVSEGDRHALDRRLAEMEAEITSRT
jgi:hypothetical protein